VIERNSSATDGASNGNPDSRRAPQANAVILPLTAEDHELIMQVKSIEDFMIRLLALDIDSTLTDAEGNIHDEVINSIGQVTTKGVDYVALVSARPPQGVSIVADLLKQEVYRICYLGAVIQLPDQNEIQRLLLDMKVARSIARFADERDLSLTLNINDIEYHTRNQTRPSMVPCVSVDSAESVLEAGTSPVIIGTVGHNSSLLVYEFCTEHHAGSIYIPRTSMTDGNLVSTLIANPLAQKGNAVVSLCSYLSINPNEVMAIGDSESDASMFQVVGSSVAVGNADRIARQTAKIIAPLPYGEGVKWTLEHLL
jgi:hydroxymethylpyrimidine pyrophosphatase-like HAD family hydrolase